MVGGLKHAGICVALAALALAAWPATSWAVADVVINEVDSVTPGPDAAEFIELYDGGTGNTSLNGLVVVTFRGDTDRSYNLTGTTAIDLDGDTTDASGYFTLGNIGLNLDPQHSVFFSSGALHDGPAAVAVYAANGTDFPKETSVTTTNLVDAVVYDNGDADDPELLTLLNPGQPQVNESDGGAGLTHSILRFPNGSGGARNTSTFAVGTPTPGAAASSAVTFVPGVDSPIAAGATSVSGTSSEPNGTQVEVFRNGVSVATTSVASGAWTLTVPELVAGNQITARATADATLPVKSTSPPSPAVTVGAASPQGGGSGGGGSGGGGGRGGSGGGGGTVSDGDLDDDGVADAADACATLAARTRSGCPPAAVKLRLSYSPRKRRFKGRVESAQPACLAGRRVTIFKRAHGHDTELAGRETNARGKFRLRAPPARGSYYAVVDERVVSDVAACNAATSSRLRVRRRS